MWKEMAVIDEIMNYSSAYRQAFASDQGAWWWCFMAGFSWFAGVSWARLTIENSSTATCRSKTPSFDPETILNYDVKSVALILGVQPVPVTTLACHWCMQFKEQFIQGQSISRNMGILRWRNDVCHNCWPSLEERKEPDDRFYVTLYLSIVDEAENAKYLLLNTTIRTRLYVSSVRTCLWFPFLFEMSSNILCMRVGNAVWPTLLCSNLAPTWICKVCNT
jgi:hypothetical protein